MWSRPEHIPTGTVWCRFQAIDKEGVPGLMYQIRDMDEAQKEACLDLMCEIFVRDEPLSKALDAMNDQESIATARAYWSKYMDQKMSIACYTEVDGEPKDLIGFNLLVVLSKNHLHLATPPQGMALKKLITTVESVERLVDVYEYFGVDTYLTSCGLIVLPEHRGQNIGAQLLGVRKYICKTFGIKATCTTFTATSSQISAARCGFEVLAELEYSEMLEHGIDLLDCESPRVKVMGRKYE